MPVRKLFVMNIQTIVSDLNQQGYFSLPKYTDVQRHLTNRLLENWRYFVKQDMNEKLLHAYGGPQGNGYEYRGTEYPDYKETFHLSLPYTLPVGASAVDRSMVDTGKELITAIIPLVQLVGKVMSEASDIKDLDLLMLASPENYVLRLLYYPPDPREIRAESHVDKGITIHLIATASGLQIWWNNVWVNVEELVDSAYGYAGLLGQYYTQCKLKALLHQVVSCEKTKSVGRFSIVVFIDFGDVRYDKPTFGRLQDRFPKGENYTMEFVKLKELFAPANEISLT
jgi:isopenicillin N synthase-like dioxygenase